MLLLRLSPPRHPASAWGGASYAAASASRSAWAPPPPSAATALIPGAVTPYTRSPQVPTQWRVLQRVPHDSSAFTQGLAWRGREMYEGTGIYGAGSLRRVSLARGEYNVESSTPLEASLFGEGVTLWPTAPEPEQLAASPAPAPAPTVLQLTWQEKRVLTYDADTLATRGTFSFTSERNEGWGLTHDGNGTLFMSDGSATLHAWAADPAIYTPAGRMVETGPRVPVRDAVRGATGASMAPGGSWAREEGEGWQPSGTGPLLVNRPTRIGNGLRTGSSIGHLNELEWVHGWVFANIWYDTRIAIIQPLTGAVVWYLDLEPLYADNPGRDCLNGIAYTMRLDTTGEPQEGGARVASEVWGGRLWVTGKLWNYLYEIELGGLVDADVIAQVSASSQKRKAKQLQQLPQ